MAENTTNTNQKTRIIYIEPNNQLNNENGNLITPDYSDFCISFDLIVEVVSRLQTNEYTVSYNETDSNDDNNDGNSSNKKYIISWKTNFNPFDKKGEVANEVSFMAGEQVKDKSYLTTYYTDTHYNDFKKKSIVEGLGVESVNISFESYFAPTVKIRFIDVRGASLFGREEALHTDEVLSEDTIWGCFFTFPYPKYKLQVKGFYGKAVTFQLACTDFRANFNSQTGNYEIDMSFLGYDFGLLADMPMQYLIAAPYCDYSDTISYWNKQKSSNPAWRMSNGGEVETFKDIKDNIRTAIEKFNTNGIPITTEEYEVDIVDYERKSAMDEIKDYLLKIENYNEDTRMTMSSTKTDANKSLALKVDTNISTAEDKKFLEQSLKELGGIPKPQPSKEEKLKKDVEEVKKLLDEYREKWPDKELSKVSSDIIDEWSYKKTIKSPSAVNPYGLELVEYVKSNLNDGTEQTFDKFFAGKFEIIKKAFDEDYASLNTVEKRQRNIQSTNDNPGKIQDLVGFIPNIGNVFRTLYCHLETFTHMVYRCARNIYTQIEQKERTPDKLGMSLQNTDISLKNEKIKDVIPFPTIYTYKQIDKDANDSEDGDVLDDEVAVDAWVGELKNVKTPWEEKYLIDALFKAVLLVSKNEDEGKSIFSTMEFPVLPCDLNHDYIPGVALNASSGDLSGYLALRAAALFGVAGYSDADAEEAGMMDALNYFKDNPIKENIKENIFKTLGNGSKSDALYNISLCQGELAQTINPFPFEVGKDLKGVKIKRHPFFVKDTHNNLQYCYTEDKKSNAFVPIRLSRWSDVLNDILTFNGQNDGSYFSFKTVNGHSNLLYKQYSEEFFIDNTSDNERKGYVDSEVFNVYYSGQYSDGSSVTEKVTEIYKKLKDGAINLNEYTKSSDSNRFKNILRNHWYNVDDKEFEKTYYSSLQSLYPSLTILLGKDSDENDKEKYKKILNKNVVISDGKFKYENKELSEDDCYPLIPEFRIFEKDTDASLIVNVFTSQYYYMQNESKKRFDNYNSFKYSDRDFAVDAVKCMFFLMTLDHKADGKPNYLKNGKTACIELIPLSIMLFHGALLWRKRFYEINKFDPITYKGKTENGIFRFKTIEIDEVPIVNVDDGMLRGLIGYNSSKTYVKFEKIFGTFDLDDAIETQIIEVFINFVKSDKWKTIKDNCEFTYIDGNSLSYSDFVTKLAQGKYEDGVKTLIDEVVVLCGERFLGGYDILEEGDTKQNLLSVLSSDNPANEIIKKIYLSKITVQKTVKTFNKQNGSITISDSTYKKYITSFIKQLEEICDTNSDNLETNDSSDDDEDNVDIKRLMYSFIKNIWDRWLCSNSEEIFSCQNYMRNTVFVDSMYRNVYTRIHINCEVLLDLLSENDGKSMVFKFLSDITTKHHCMYFAMPDYANWEKSGFTTEESMNELFTPLPYSKINPIETMNRYIIMFTYKPSEINSDDNTYKYDSFDIYSHDEDNDAILPTFKRELIGKADPKDEHSMQCSRYGYNLPAFGVEFGRQNNAIFKKINVGMQNPVQTEQAINALSLIAERGRGAGQRMIFYGQDLYNVFSGYSYTATIEMMGNAQIMPLMYFQLFNIPMFRGAYMIYGVTHTMKPGDMTTTVKAMKMSKFALPFCKNWYAHYYFDEKGNIHSSDHDDECIIYYGDNPWLKVAYKELGVKENPMGENKGKDVEKYQKTTGNGPGAAWCGSFVNYCLLTSGVANLPKNASVANAYVEYGQTLDKPAEGAIAIVYGNGEGKKATHVGFVAGVNDKGKIVVLGGNQGDSVSFRTYFDEHNQIKKYVFPPGYKPNYVLQKINITDKTKGEVKTT